MKALVILVILICGYVYTDSHYQSRVRSAKENGWGLYFFVALKGCAFIGSGFALAIFIFIFLFLISCGYNFIFHDLFLLSNEINLYEWMEKDWMDMSFFIWISMLFAICISASQADTERKKAQSYEYRIKEYENLAKSNNIENLIFQSIKERKLVFISLKSRKVYIGYITAPRFEHSETESISLIPFLSGYRDKDTLEFRLTTDYSEIYVNESITTESEPLNLSHFRHVIPMDHIESISIFDTTLYKKFKRDNKGA
ncbi:hypothetical protein LE36_14970 [Salmonella enterica subsp. diarizonae]|nr:hypothetical protein [Salmonella enterica subsp. diarizonae]